jgi:hypothetical protein
LDNRADLPINANRPDAVGFGALACAIADQLAPLDVELSGKSGTSSEKRCRLLLITPLSAVAGWHGGSCIDDGYGGFSGWSTKGHPIDRLAELLPWNSNHQVAKLAA